MDATGKIESTEN